MAARRCTQPRRAAASRSSTTCSPAAPTSTPSTCEPRAGRRTHHALRYHRVCAAPHHICTVSAPAQSGAHACRRGKTPLRYAVRGGHSMAAALLRAAGGVLLWPEADAALRQVEIM